MKRALHIVLVAVTLSGAVMTTAGATELGVSSAHCVKIEMQDGFGPSWTADQAYTRVTIKAGTERFTWNNVQQGDVLTVPNGKDISHVVMCNEQKQPVPSTTVPSTPTSTVPKVTTTVPEVTSTTAPITTTSTSSPPADTPPSSSTPTTSLPTSTTPSTTSTTQPTTTTPPTDTTSPPSTTSPTTTQPPDITVEDDCDVRPDETCPLPFTGIGTMQIAGFALMVIGGGVLALLRAREVERS